MYTCIDILAMIYDNCCIVITNIQIKIYVIIAMKW